MGADAVPVFAALGDATRLALVDQVAAQWDDAAEQLRAFVEEG